LIRFKLKKALDDRNKTMYWLSKEAEVRPNTISQWVKGDVNSITVETLDKLCDALDCEIGDIIEHVKSKEADK
jgi:putative transcriptional regulator